MISVSASLYLYAAYPLKQGWKPEKKISLVFFSNYQRMQHIEKLLSKLLCSIENQYLSSDVSIHVTG